MNEMENPTAEETEAEPSILEKLGAALLGKDSVGYGYAETDPESGITHYADPNEKLAPLITYDDDDENLGLINSLDSYNKKSAVNDPLYSRIISDPLTGEYFDASELREAKTVKEAEAEAQADYYNSLSSAPDYAEKTKAVTDGRYGDLYNYINDIGGTRDKVYDDVGAENNGLAVYEYLSPEEVGTYNYLCATQGRSEAEKYLGSLQNTLNQRLGKYIASQFEGDTAMQVMYGLTSGADRLVNETAGALTGEDYSSAASYAKEKIYGDLGGGRTILGKTPVQYGYDVADTVGHDAPSYVSGIIVGGLLDDALAAGSAGEYVDDAIEGAGDAEKIITEVKYTPSSGAILKANPNKTTTILGSFEKDMKNVANEMGNVKSTYIEAKKGGFNVLNVPDDMYKSADQFWNEINKPWLDKAIKRGDDIVALWVRLNAYFLPR